MRRRIRNIRRDKRYFAKTSNKTKKINTNVNMRGGIRL